MVWDTGRWVPRGDPIAGYRAGHLKFTLQGRKLKGNWSLIRTRGGRYAGNAGREAWLLVKEVDEHAKPGSGSIVDTAADSVISGRTLDEIARPAKGSGNRAGRLQPMCALARSHPRGPGRRAA